MPPNHGEIASVIKTVEKRLGWNQNFFEGRRSWSFHCRSVEDQEMFFVLRNTKNQANRNIWHEKCFEPFLSRSTTAKAPIVVYKYYNNNASNFHGSLTFHKLNLMAVKDYVEKPVDRNVF